MKHARGIIALLGIVVLAQACAGDGAGGSRAAATALHDLFDREWEFRLAEDPLKASSVGRHETGDRLPSVAPADQERRAERWRGFLAELDGIDREGLSRKDQVNHDIFRSQLESFIADIEFRAYEIPVNADSGFHSDFARLPAEVPLRTPADYAAYIARMEAFPGYVAQQIANMRAGMARGFVLPRVVLEGYDASIAAHVVDSPEKSEFWKPFAAFPGSVPESDRGMLAERGRAAIEDGVVAGYEAFLRFMVDEYIPAARPTIGASELPDGEAYYRQRIAHFTTLDLSAEEVHQIGVAEVARIRAEMEQVIREVEFGGTFEEFLEFLRTDSRFYAETSEQLIEYAAFLSKKMDGQLPALFKTLPRLPYGVEPVPAAIAPKYTTGRYVPAPRGSTRPGYYWVNTYALENRPLYNLEALTLHEAVPGHHLQISLNNEIEDLPDFRRFSYISAFGEGWGLYSEWLGLEAGFYEDPYSNFGRLTYEMWRACRLVVDTGMHAMGWSREQAMEFMASNTALALHNVRTETDRYISWPGQALSYKIGELKIRELRRRAESALGDRFDVREFHDAVLLQGSVPLPVLEQQIESWIAEQ